MFTSTRHHPGQGHQYPSGSGSLSLSFHSHHQGDSASNYHYQNQDRSRESYLNQSCQPPSPSREQQNMVYSNSPAQRGALNHRATAFFHCDQFAVHSPANRLYQPRREVDEHASSIWTPCRSAVQPMGRGRDQEREELSAARHKYVYAVATTHTSPIQAANPKSDLVRRPSLPTIASWFVDPIHRPATTQSPPPIATNLRPPPPPPPSSIPSPTSPGAHPATQPATQTTTKSAKPPPKCPHGKRRAQCLSCFDLGQGGGSICAHRRRKDLCGECQEYVRRGFEPSPVPGARPCRRGRRRRRVLVPWGGAAAVCEGTVEARKVDGTNSKVLSFSVEALLGIAGGDSGAAAAVAADGDCCGFPRHGGVRCDEESGHLEVEDDGESATPVLSPRSLPLELEMDLEGIKR
ncbi:hypothetical protein DFJ73DRAFT_963416 [Zopfochytrium polystomum]|nr:hypothetical protein DFJ73DRAFT_963416 [Zopfochytrium polystomum]